MRESAQLTRLDNGLRVLTRQVSAPVTALYLWFEVGAADEPAELSGAAHFLEHLVFKGTSRRGVGESAAEIEGLGGDLNAWTSHDQTVLHATVEASAWSQALDVLVDMAWHSVLAPEEVERERSVILEEIRGYAEDPDTVAREASDAQLFGSHAYGRPVLGTPETVAAITREALLGFRHRHYVPGRAILAVAGPVEHEAVLHEACRLVASRARGEERPALAQPAPSSAGSPVVIAPTFETPLVDLAWRTPDLSHPDVPALDVLAAAIGQGAASALTVQLRLRDRLVSDAWCDHAPLEGAGTLHVGLQPLPGKSAEAVEATIAILSKVGSQGLPGRVISRARDALLADLAFAGETVDSIAQDLAWYSSTRDDPEFGQRWRRAIAGVTASDVQRAAQRWLSPTDVVVTGVGPVGSAEALARAARVDPTPRLPSRRDEPVHLDLPGGVRLVVLPDDGPVVGVRVVAAGGGLDVPTRSAGLGAAWARMLLCGAGELDAESFGATCDSLGAVFEPTARRGSVGVSLSLPREHIEDGLSLLGELLTAPSFERQEWLRIHEELLEDLRTRADRPLQVASEHMWRALWPGHPWRLPLGGTEASLSRIGPAAVRRFHDSQFATSRLVIGVAGGVEPEAIEAMLAPWIAMLSSGSPAPVVPCERPPLRGRRTLCAGREQAVVLCASRGVPVHHDDQVALRLATAVLASQGGRLFTELREERGLAYHVWCNHVTGLQGGVLTAGLATEPERAEQALRQLRATLQRFGAEGPTQAELDRARAMLVGQAAMSLQRASARASELASTTLLDLPYGVGAFRERLDGVRRAAVREAFERAALVEGLRLVVRPSA